MDKKQHQEIKNTLEQIQNELKGDNLTQEEREKLELHAASLAGSLLSSWLPIGIVRKVAMLTFFCIGILGFITEYEWLIWSFLLACGLSPRIAGEVAFRLGQSSK